MKVLDFEFDKTKRILVTSDIHGEGDFLKECLDKLDFDIHNDYLVVVGDYIEKGRSNFETLHYLMDLEERFDNVIIIMGNNDFVIPYFMGDTFGVLKGVEDELVYSYKKYINRETLFKDIAEIENVDVYDYDKMLELMHGKYNYILEWVKNRPFVVRTDDFIFVHAGLNAEGIIESSTYLELVNNDYFSRGFVNNTGKTIVVGHFPTAIYNAKGIDYKVRYDDNNVISIDGGLVITMAGGLNILEIKFDDSKPIFKDYHFHFGETKRVICDYTAKQPEEVIRLLYPYISFKLIEEYDDFVKVLQIKSEKEMVLHKDLFDSLDGQIIYSTTYINEQTDLKKGQTIRFIYEFNSMSLIKVGSKVFEVPSNIIE